jgi:hypothetical protein
VRRHAQSEEVVLFAQVSDVNDQSCVQTKYAPYLLGNREPLLLCAELPSAAH